MKKVSVFIVVIIIILTGSFLSCRRATLWTDSSLISLEVSSGILDPAFSPYDTDYALLLKHNTASVTFTPTANNPEAGITIEGTEIESGTESDAYAVPADSSIEINIIVTAEDEVTTTEYIIVVTRALYIEEPFDYGTPGDVDLMSKAGVMWTEIEAGTVDNIYSSASLSFTSYSSGTGGSCHTDNRDVDNIKLPFGRTLSTGTVYFAFLFHTNTLTGDPTGGTNSNRGPVIGFTNGTDRLFSGIIYCYSTSDYNFAVGVGTQYIVADITPGNTYLAVLKVDMDNNDTDVFFNPDVTQEEPVPDLDLTPAIGPIDGVFMNFNDWNELYTTGNQIIVDEIKITQFWEELAE